MFKKIISVLASAAMLLTVFDISAAVFAEPAEELTGSCGTSVTYTLSDDDSDGYYDKLVISGTGDMTDYIFNTDGRRTYYVQTETINGLQFNTHIKNIIVGEGVTSVGDYAFWGFRGTESVTLPSTLKKIGENSFIVNEKLTEIVFPDGLEIIGSNAFQSCKNLTSVKIPNGVKSIGEYAFNDCLALTSIEIPDSVEIVGTNIFFQCDNLTQVMYPSGLDLSNAQIPAAATQIKYEAAEGGVIISEIILGAGKTETDIPDRVCGITVVGVAEDYRDKVSPNGHTHVNEREKSCTQKAVCKFCGEYGDFEDHTGSAATCTGKAVCENCGAEYGEFAEHNYENGTCTVCNAPDPNYIQPTETEPTTAEPTVTTTADTEPTETSPASTVPTGTSPSIPSRPSYPSSPVTTAAETTVTTVTTTTTTIAEEIIYDEQPDEDVSVGALAYADNSDIPEKSKGLIAFAAAVLVAAVLTIKKRFF